MENFKVLVKDESESKEIQGLFFELGYEKGACSVGNYPANIVAMLNPNFQKTSYSSRATYLNHKDHEGYKEITLPELRDLVVLKRNSIDDANYIRPRDGKLYFVNSGQTRSYYMMDDEWTLTKWDEGQLQQQLKPIEKPMKEYLLKTEDGIYHYHNDSHDECPKYVEKIEIPEGAHSFRKNHRFYNDNGSKFYDSSNCWVKSTTDRFAILWQRPSPPEELPFIDDEPSFEKHINTMKSLRMPCMPKPSLNDQYAEIEKVRQEQKGIDATLAERQTQYGCFEDVAHVTQGMISLMRQCGYDNMPQPHQMALSMIASKMARIVNGDFNHLDSWHDIGGYAKLVENIIGEPK